MGLEGYLIVSVLLFGIGAFGFMARRNAILMLISIELMFNAVNLSLVAFNAFLPPAENAGAVFALMIMAVAAAEVTVAWRSSSRSSAPGRRPRSTSTPT